MATEDIGLADPRALQICLESWDSFERLGSPEGELALAQAAVYLASAPKSNAVYTAYGAVKASIAEQGSLEVPVHLRNAPTKLAKELGHGAEYRYAHDEENGFAAGENYLPEAIHTARFYSPKDSGLESRIKEKLARLQQLDAEASNQRYSKK
jgi:putative ATPase